VLCGFLADSEPHDVYNLTVDGAHEFYANGILVHNCDALRYLLVNLGTGPEFTVFDTPEPNAVAEAITPLEPMGAFAYQRSQDEPVWSADDDAPRRTVRTAELRGVWWPSGTGSAVTAATSMSRRRRGRLPPHRYRSAPGTHTAYQWAV
jgi:hypothetical protein